MLSFEIASIKIKQSRPGLGVAGLCGLGIMGLNNTPGPLIAGGALTLFATGGFAWTEFRARQASSYASFYARDEGLLGSLQSAYAFADQPEMGGYIVDVLAKLPSEKFPAFQQIPLDQRKKNFENFLTTRQNQILNLVRFTHKSFDNDAYRKRRMDAGITFGSELLDLYFETMK